MAFKNDIIYAGTADDFNDSYDSPRKGNPGLSVVWLGGDGGFVGVAVIIGQKLLDIQCH